MTCVRQQSTWAKRGGWDCDTPTLTRDMDAEVSFLSGKSTLFISFDSTLSFEAAEGLARRALVLFENTAAPPPPRCVPGTSNDRDWKGIRELQLRSQDKSMLNVFIIGTQGGVLQVHPFGASAPVFTFQPDAVADPSNAAACWDVQIIVD